MGKKRTKDRLSNEINAGSMADIAFLLLIFFLVTTTIAEDKGLLVLLPPWSDEPAENIKQKSRNVYSVLVNSDNQLLVRGQPMDIRSLKENTKNFIKNPTQAEDMAESPDRALISLKNDRGTKYKTYLSVYNELKAAYTDLRNEEGEKRYGKKFEFLTKDQQRTIMTAIPLVISEAEPTSFGSEE